MNLHTNPAARVILTSGRHLRRQRGYIPMSAVSPIMLLVITLFCPMIAEGRGDGPMSSGEASRLVDDLSSGPDDPDEEYGENDDDEEDDNSEDEDLNPFVDHQTIDGVDIENITRLLGIDHYRFVLPAQPNGRRLGLNYVADVYEQGKLTSHLNFADTILSRFGLLDSSRTAMILNAILRDMSVGDSAILFRVYTARLRRDEVTLQFGLGGGTQTLTYPIDTALYEASGTHSFPYRGLRGNETVPLVSYYFNHHDEELLDCPKDASVEEIRSLYPMVIVLSLEPRELVETDE